MLRMSCPMLDQSVRRTWLFMLDWNLQLNTYAIVLFVFEQIGEAYTKILLSDNGVLRHEAIRA